MPPSSAAQEDCPIVTAPQPRAALKPLSELHWPLVDQDRLAVFSDPLRKDEILPIRQAEWEQIGPSTPPLLRVHRSSPPLLLSSYSLFFPACVYPVMALAATSSSLRALLTNEPDLKHLLQRVLSAGQTTQPCVDNPNAAKDQIQQLLLQLAPSSQSPSLHSFSHQAFLLFNQFADIIRSILVKNRP